jgi:hypothetical protein
MKHKPSADFRAYCCSGILNSEMRLPYGIQ